MASEKAVIVLLRAVNVGGNNKLPMAALREALTKAGLSEVRTYIQSGNVVCQSRLNPAKVARLVESTIETEFGLHVPSVALSADELAEAIAQWPVPSGALPKTLHCIVFDRPVSAEQTARIDKACLLYTSPSPRD